MSIDDFYHSSKSRGLRRVEWDAVCKEDGRHRGHKMRLCTDTHPPFERNPSIMSKLRRILKEQHANPGCGGGHIQRALVSVKYKYAEPAVYYGQWDKNSYRQDRRQRHEEKKRSHRIDRRLRRRVESMMLDVAWCPRDK